jgi:hypothetical protein
MDALSMTGLDHIMDSTMTVPKDRNMLQQKKVAASRGQGKHWALMVDLLLEVFCHNFVLHSSNDQFIARNIARGFTNSKGAHNLGRYWDEG